MTLRLVLRTLLRSPWHAATSIGTIALTVSLAATVFAIVDGVLFKPSTLLNTPEIDMRVVAFALFAAIVPVVICAVVPAVGVLRAAPARRLSGAQTTTSRERQWGRGTLLIVESALGVVLVVLGALLLASFVNVRTEDPGFDRRQLAIVELLIPVPSEREAGHARAFEVMASMFGAGRVAALDVWLLQRTYAGSQFPQPEGSQSFFASDIPVSERSFDIAGVELLEGRYPTLVEPGGSMRLPSAQTRRRRTGQANLPWVRFSSRRSTDHSPLWVLCRTSESVRRTSHMAAKSIFRE
ncbi:MAG: hypothetical protein EHM55_03210, partial [Acidobacteria bacterium]